MCGVWSSFDALERLATGAKCRLAARVEQSRTWRDNGERSAADWMAHQSGTTTGRSRACLEASKALSDLPETDAALAAGELSDQQAAAICGAAGSSGTDPDAEARLLQIARRRELRELREAAARVRASAEDGAERAKRLHDQRSLRTWIGADGSWNLAVRNTPEMGAELEAALAPLRESIFQLARRAGRHQPGEAYGADALVELVRRSVGADDVARVAVQEGRAGDGRGSEDGNGGGPAAPSGVGDELARPGDESVALRTRDPLPEAGASRRTSSRRPDT
ncbi:MAG: 13E12 repeat family protein [Actinobacteria bacterium]|nr:13E12 repeat family protein [Actinomycetota bacterium]